MQECLKRPKMLLYCLIGIFSTLLSVQIGLAKGQSQLNCCYLNWNLELSTHAVGQQKMQCKVAWLSCMFSLFDKTLEIDCGWAQGWKILTTEARKLPKQLQVSLVPGKTQGKMIAFWFCWVSSGAVVCCFLDTKCCQWFVFPCSCPCTSPSLKLYPFMCATGHFLTKSSISLSLSPLGLSYPSQFASCR